MSEKIKDNGENDVDVVLEFNRMSDEFEEVKDLLRKSNNANADKDAEIERLKSQSEMDKAVIEHYDSEITRLKEELGRAELEIATMKTTAGITNAALKTDSIRSGRE